MFLNWTPSGLNSLGCWGQSIFPAPGKQSIDIPRLQPILAWARKQPGMNRVPLSVGAVLCGAPPSMRLVAEH
jgi:hypothetical protein